ncbi:ferritin-like domain-containing protein [Occallatibacter savannae]|uniref:ferritin-like domain-containing protein n=1 Tax=Occallatibacter savannae TaxID=1002691 RepID=UPI000D69E650|nr:ferritin-like domain-containing protein [Occallatibacter savannae]
MEQTNRSKGAIDRRSFVTNGLAAAGLATAGVGLLSSGSSALADDEEGEHSRRLSRGDAALLRFAAAAEILETDFWVQYNELCGIPDKEVPGGSGNAAFTAALSVLDADMAQYVHDNTDDEFTHQNFLNAYLVSKGADPVDLEPFRTLVGSTAKGSSGKLRLTNLMELTLDTSWWTRYRSDSHNPDLDPSFVFPQAVPTLAVGKHTAIPRTDADTTDPNFLQAIANTAGFHMPTIEQGGNSLYPAMAQRASSVEVLRILISIGPTETMHFQTWADKAGNAPPLTAVDPVTGVSVTFPDLNSPPFGGEQFQTNLIMPEPCPFISRKLPKCSVIRPTETKGIAKGVVKFLTDMGLFSGQSPAFFSLMRDLAEDADEARREH